MPSCSTAGTAPGMAFRASTSRINVQQQPSLREDVEDPAQLGALHVQRRRPGSLRLKRAGSSGKFERRGHYEACGTVKLLLAFPLADGVKPFEQALLAEVSVSNFTHRISTSFGSPSKPHHHQTAPTKQQLRLEKVSCCAGCRGMMLYWCMRPRRSLQQ